MQSSFSRMHRETEEGRSLLTQLASTPLLGREKERDLAYELWRLRALIQEVEAAAEESFDSEIAQEYSRQLDLLRHEFIKDRDALFAANTRLILNIIAPMSRMEYMDMFQLGCFGLMRAIDLYDPSRNVSFSTYATRWIRQAIQRGCDNEESLIVLPVHIRDMLKHIRRTEIAYTQSHGETPTLEMICHEAGLDYDHVLHVQLVHAIPESLEREHHMSLDGQKTVIEELVADQEPDVLDWVIENDQRIQTVRLIHEALHQLETFEVKGTYPYRDHAAIIRYRYRIGEDLHDGIRPMRTLEEVGNLVGMHKSRVRQLQRAGMKWISEYLLHTLEEDG